MLDHLCRSNTKWRAAVMELQTCPDRVLKDWLTHQWIDGQNGWDLSAKLETFIANWVVDNIDTRRIQLAGGENERGNDFEIGRQLLLEHHGKSQAVQL